jgi:hypothetical protein
MRKCASKASARNLARLRVRLHGRACRSERISITEQKSHRHVKVGVNMRCDGRVHFAGAVLPLAWTFVCPKVCGMINRCVVALFCLFCASSAFAQLIRVELQFDQETYLPREPMPALVKVVNTSGRTLVLGQDNEWLSFIVENEGGSPVGFRKPLDVTGEFSLPSSQRAKKWVNLADVYELGKFGRYMVRAVVKVPEWAGETFVSKEVPVGIATGVKVWETNFGMPAQDKNGRPEPRTYELLSANHVKQLSLYVRVTGETAADTIALYPIGKLHGFSQPEPQMDRWSNLHVLYQDGARSFRYNLITPDGLLLARQSWDIDGTSRPALKLDSDGHIGVSGGVRHVSSDDLPPADLLAQNAEPEPVPEPRPAKKDAKKSKK